MNIRIEKELPKELLEHKIAHYKEIFEDDWEKVFQADPTLDPEEKVLVMEDADKIVGGCVARESAYSLKFKDFAILPENRGKGYAKTLMKHLEEMAKTHHQRLIESGDKPKDIGMMYLRSLVYLDSPGDIPVLQFGQFLRRFGFNPYLPNVQPYDAQEFSKEEKVAVEVYRERYPQLADRLRVFKKLVVDDGIELRDEIKDELLTLRKRPDKWKIVEGALDWKLGHYHKSGEVSYKYDLCQICKDMGQGEVVTTKARSQSPCPAEDCYIYVTCMEPFRRFFKEDNEISGAYFSAMRDFMEANKNG